MSAGRPLAYQTPEELEKAVEEYFRNNERVTLSGLALHLGFESRQSLYNYGQREDFLDIIKSARMRVEATYEERLIYEPNQTGVIFALKNMNWSDKNEIDHTTGGEKINKVQIEIIGTDSKDTGQSDTTEDS